MNEYIQAAQSPLVKEILRLQWKSAVEERQIECPCGQVRALELAFRCLYCGAWFCSPCAENHFGETILGRRKRMRAERRTS